MPTKSDLPKDFDAGALVSASKSHARQLRSLSGQIADLSTPATFSENFIKAQRESKLIDEAIIGIIEKYDTHKIKMNGIAIAKWIIAGAIGAFMSWLISQVFTVPAYQTQITSLQNEIEQLKKITPRNILL